MFDEWNICIGETEKVKYVLCYPVELICDVLVSDTIEQIEHKQKIQVKGRQKVVEEGGQFGRREEEV